MALILAYLRISCLSALSCAQFTAQQICETKNFGKLMRDSDSATRKSPEIIEIKRGSLEIKSGGANFTNVISNAISLIQRAIDSRECFQDAPSRFFKGY